MMFAGIGIYGGIVTQNLYALAWSFLVIAVGATMLIAGAKRIE